MLDDKSIENLMISQDKEDEDDDENMKNDELLQSQDKVYIFQINKWSIYINSSLIYLFF